MQAINDQFAKTFERMDLISGKIDSVKAELQGQLDAVSRDISAIKADCAANFETNDRALRVLDERVDAISQEIGGLANRNELIVSGIPYTKNEDLLAYFRAMWKHVGLHEQSTAAVDIRRLNKTQSDGIILLQFALKNNRDDFYSGYLRQRDLQLCHLGINSSRRVYINENLTVTMRKIKAAALRLKKEGKLSSVFSKLGVVYVKRPDDQQPVAVNSEEHLINLTMTKTSS